MKISFVEPHLKIFGGIRRIIEISNRLTKRGHDVTIFHSDGSPCKWMKCIAKVKSYDEVLRESHDVIIYNDPNPIDYKLVKKARAKLKVFYVLGLYEEALLKGIKPRIYLPGNRRMLFIKKSLQSPYLKLTCSSWLYYWLRDEMHIDSKLVIGGVNTELFHQVEIEQDPNEFRILCSGGLRKHEGTETVMKAVEISKKQEPRITLDTYHGKGLPQEKMAEKYSSADIFVDGRWHGGWNNPVAEAMACKVLVVCTDIGGVKDFAFNEKTALLVPVKNPEAMAASILRLIGNAKLRDTLRENAYNHIRQFDWDKSAERLEEILAAEIEMAHFNPSYIGPRQDIVNLIPGEVRKVLDVGCSTGVLGESIKRKNGAEVTGIEVDEEMANVAKEKLDRVLVGDIENISLLDYFSPNYFDCIIFADVLEHLRDGWKVLAKSVNLLSENGIIIASVPNVRHYSTIFSLIFRGIWPYRERGIHDQTHLRFFTLKNIEEMFRDAALEITKIERKYRIIEKPHRYNRFSKYIAHLFLKDLLTFQYLIVARKNPARSHEDLGPNS